MRYLFEEYAFDTDRRELHRGADVVSVAPQVFDLLDYLIRNRERVVSKDDLIKAIWNGRSVSDAALTTRLNVARSAIGDSGEEQRLIKTLPRKGFRFVGQLREAQGPAGAEVAYRPVEPPKPALTLPNKPSIAVLPFANLSADPEQDRLGATLGCATYLKVAYARPETASASRVSSSMPKPEPISGRTILMVGSKICSIYRTM